MVTHNGEEKKASGGGGTARPAPAASVSVRTWTLNEVQHTRRPCPIVAAEFAGLYAQMQVESLHLVLLSATGKTNVATD